DRPFKTGEWAYAGSIRVENPFASVGDGVYKASYHHVEATGVGTPNFAPKTEGITLQFDQDFGDIGVFGKYSRTWGRKAAVEQFAHAGIMWTRPFGYEEDNWGVGFGWVDPTAANTRDEYVAETFYKMQVTPFVSVTADAMLVINPSSNPNGNDTEGVFSVRSRMHF
ncbi:MAG: carbohydrate porin, partial [Anderseniella sp.]